LLIVACDVYEAFTERRLDTLQLRDFWEYGVPDRRNLIRC